MSNYETRAEEVHARLMADPTVVFFCALGHYAQLLPQTDPCTVQIVPGSFNPMHAAHQAIWNQALRYVTVPGSGHQVFFELSVSRLGKELLSPAEMAQRLTASYNSVFLLTNVPRLIEKAAVIAPLLGPATFHIGIDTYNRAVEDYGAIGIGGVAAKFVVYPRMIDGVVQHLPERHAANVSGGSLHKDVQGLSSTAIRAKP